MRKSATYLKKSARKLKFQMKKNRNIENKKLKQPNKKYSRKQH